MAYYVVAAGGNLYSIGSGGTVTLLTLPSGVTIDTSKPARMAVLGREVVVVNAPSRSLAISPLGVVRPMSPIPPISPPALAESATVGLLGAGPYYAAYTHIIKDPDSGALLAESAMSPTSAGVTITSSADPRFIDVSGVQPSPDAEVTHRRLYRTTSNGATFFPWMDIDGNVVTTASDDLTDANLQLIAAPSTLGTPPGALPTTFMTLVAQWKNRLWGVGNVEPETLRYSGIGSIYGWPASFAFDIPPLGRDSFGITGLMPRRDELGVARRDALRKIVGNDETDFASLDVKSGVGCWAPDSVVVIDDVAYFLGENDVWAWGPDGIRSASDAGGVRAWFATATYFNRSKFPNAFAKYNNVYNLYELHLAAAGSSNIDRWVALDVKSGRWYGPHKTDAFTPTAAGVVVDSSDLTNPVMCGSDGYVYLQNQAGFLDQATVIAYAWDSKYHDGRTPSIAKAWQRLTLVSKAQAAYGNMVIAIRHKLNGAQVQTFTPDGRVTQQTLGHCGEGEFCQLNFSGTTAGGQGAELYGYELPFHELGLRGPR